MILSPYRFGGQAVVQLEANSVFNINAAGFARYILGASGEVYENDSIYGTPWINDSAAVGLFEVRATLVAGDPGQPAGTLGVWQSCSADRQWSVTSSANGTTETATILVEIRRASTLVVEASADVTINAAKQMSGLQL